MRFTIEQVVEQLIVDKHLGTAFSAGGQQNTLIRELAHAEARLLRRKADRVERGIKRTSPEETNQRKRIKHLKERIANVGEIQELSQEEIRKILETWTGGAFSGLIFDRRLSTVGCHLAELHKIDEALKKAWACPIMVDDSGEGSYTGDCYGIFYDEDSLRAYLLKVDPSRHIFANEFEFVAPWQWMAGVFVWDRRTLSTQVPPKRPKCTFVRRCEPGWHWVKFGWK